MTTVIAGTSGQQPLPDPTARRATTPARKPDREPGPRGPAPTWRVTPVRPQDEAALAELFARCSAETVRLRFFGRPRELPRPYLDAMLAGRPETHDAVLAYPEFPEGADGPEGYEAPDDWAGPVGLGSLTAGGIALNGDQAPGASPYPGADAPPVGELGLLVVDDWQRRGAGGAMLDTLLDRARARGMRLVSASVLTGRRGLLDVLGRRLPTVRMTRDIDALTGVYRLDAERWAEAGHGGRGQRNG